MTFQQKKQLKKKFMPAYYRNYNIWGSVIMFGVLFGGLAVCIALGLTLGDSDATYITMCVYVLVLLATLITFLVVMIKMQNKLLKQRTLEIENEFVDLPFDEVTATLTEKHVITEHGFVANMGEYSGQLVVPFAEAHVSVYSANVYTKVCTVIVITNQAGGVIAEYVLDNVLFNFICKKGVKLNFVANSKYLLNDKREFVKVHIKGSSERNTMWMLFGVLGAFISNEHNDVNLSKKTVLDVLGKFQTEN